MPLYRSGNTAEPRTLKVFGGDIGGVVQGLYGAERELAITFVAFYSKKLRTLD